MLLNTAGQHIGAQMTSATDGSDVTASVSVEVSLNGGAFAAGSGTLTHLGEGWWDYAPTQAETNAAHVAFQWSATGAITVGKDVFTRAGDAFTRLGAPAGASIAADIATRASQTSVDTIDDLIDTEVAAIFSRIGAPAGASLAADVAAVKAETATILSDTNDIQTRIPAALVGGRIDANVGAISGDATAADTLESYTDGTTPMPVNVTQISGDGTAADNLEAALDGTGFEEIRRGTAQAGGATTITLDAGASATNDYYAGAMIRILSGTGAQQAPRQITDYVGATKVATVNSAWATNPSSDSVFIIEPMVEITGATAPTAAAIRAEIDANSTQLAAIVADTNDIQSKIGTPAGVSVSADLADIEGKVDDLETRLGTPSNLGSGATIAANLADIEAQTDDIGAAGAGLTAVPWNAAWDAEVQSEVTDALVAYDPPTHAELIAETDAVQTDVAAVPAAVRTNLATELGRIDAAVSTRQATLGATQYEAAADALLNRNAQGGSNTGVLVRHKLAGVPNRIVITRSTSTTGTMTIYAEDGTTIIDTLSLTFVADTGAIASVSP